MWRAFAWRGSRIGCKKKQVGRSRTGAQTEDATARRRQRRGRADGRCNLRVALIGLPFCATAAATANIFGFRGADDDDSKTNDLDLPPALPRSRPPTPLQSSKTSCNRSIIITNVKLKCHFAPVFRCARDLVRIETRVVRSLDVAGFFFGSLSLGNLRSRDFDKMR